MPKNIIDEKTLAKLTLESVKDTLSKQNLDESYFAETKPFKLVSDLISLKTKDAHQQLYAGYVNKLNRCVAQADSISVESGNIDTSKFRDAKIAESYNLNAKWLHELYFKNCFSPNSEIHLNDLSYIRLQSNFGTFDKWQNDFISCAMGAREGWAVCAYNLHLQKIVNLIIDDNSQHVMVGIYPLIVLDMWSHSYYRDYLNDKESYIIASMKEFNWEVIEGRIEIADKLAKATK